MPWPVSSSETVYANAWIRVDHERVIRPAAQRELLEETGYAAREWQHLGRIDALNGVCRAPEHIFLARGAHRVADADGQREEGITAVQLRPLAEVLELVATGGIRDGGTLAALMLALVRLGRVDAAPLS